MKKISLNLDHETPFLLKQAMMQPKTSTKNVSPLKGCKENMRPKENVSFSKDFSNVSPIKASRKESVTSTSYRSIYQQNKSIFNMEGNFSKFESSFSGHNLSKVDNKDRKSAQQNQKIASHSMFFTMNEENKNEFENKENYEPRFFLQKTPVFFDPRAEASSAQNQNENNLNAIMRSKAAKTQNYLNKLNLEHENIVEYIEDFDNSYNLQVFLMNKEYRRQYLFILIFTLIWIYIMDFFGSKLEWVFYTEGFRSNEENSFFSSFAFEYFKYSLLLMLTVSTRISSFESEYLFYN